MMMRVFTVRFSGTGRIDCRRCQHATVFPDSVKAVILDDGAATLVIDAEFPSALHRCGEEFRWVCQDCGMVQNPNTRIINVRPGMRTKSIRRTKLHCRDCGGPMNQVRLIPT